jgi:hypothetical protein
MDRMLAGGQKEIHDSPFVIVGSIIVVGLNQSFPDILILTSVLKLCTALLLWCLEYQIQTFIEY